MTARDGATVLALPPSAIADRPVATLEDLEATLEPDAVWVLGPEREPQAFARARSAFDAPAFHPPLETADDGTLHRQVLAGDGQRTAETLELAITPGRRALRTNPDGVSSAFTEHPAIAALVCDDVTTTVRPTALETRLEGAAALADALPAGRVTTVLTGSEPAGYDEVWHLEAESESGTDADTGTVRAVDHETIGGADPLADDCVSVRVRGAGPTEGYGNSQAIASLQLTADGVASVETHRITDFGLEAVTGIGPKTAERLADRGVTTRTELLETPIETLADLPGVGHDGARTMYDHARVLETGEPRRLTDESLPGEDWHQSPLCLDIETDGLSPTIIWQIGVYDPETDSYQAFLERDDPSDPGGVLEAFCDWLLGVHPNRALLTWNGWGFDYRHLGSFIAKHVPYYAEEWESIPKLDLYLWAVKDGNTLLPGRTNKLEAVAEALGYEGAGTGLDGAQTAVAYQRFMRTGEPLEWERHKSYCEDDCRALWHVYERLRAAPRASTAEASGASVSAAADAGRSSGSDSSGSTTGSEGSDSSNSSGGSEGSDGEASRQAVVQGDSSDTDDSSDDETEQTGLGDF